MDESNEIYSNAPSKPKTGALNLSPSVHSLREEGRESSGKIKRNQQEDGDTYDNEIKQITSKKDNKDA